MLEDDDVLDNVGMLEDAGVLREKWHCERSLEKPARVARLPYLQVGKGKSVRIRQPT